MGGHVHSWQATASLRPGLSLGWDGPSAALRFSVPMRPTLIWASRLLASQRVRLSTAEQKRDSLAPTARALPEQRRAPSCQRTCPTQSGPRPRGTPSPAQGPGPGSTPSSGPDTEAGCGAELPWSTPTPRRVRRGAPKARSALASVSPWRHRQNFSSGPPRALPWNKSGPPDPPAQAVPARGPCSAPQEGGWGAPRPGRTPMSRTAFWERGCWEGAWVGALAWPGARGRTTGCGCPHQAATTCLWPGDAPSPAPSGLELTPCRREGLWQGR